MNTLSLDLRQRILDSYDAGEGTRQDIADRYRVSLGMVKKLLSQRKRTGDIAPRHGYSGRKPYFTQEHRMKIKTLINPSFSNGHLKTPFFAPLTSVNTS